MEKRRTPFNVRLRELREAHGLSYRRLQNALAEEGIKITHTALRKWEMPAKTNRLPRREIIAALSKVFNVKPSFLLEEIFDARNLPNGRISQWNDVDLLTEQHHRLLLEIKAAFLDNDKTLTTTGIDNGE